MLIFLQLHSSASYVQWVQLCTQLWKQRERYWSDRSWTVVKCTFDANTGCANRPRRKCNLSIQSSTGTGLSLSIMPSGAYPVGDNALLAEHWVVNHWSGGHSCTFRDQFPHQTPRSVVAAHMDHFDPCRSPSREKFHSWIPIDFRHNRVAVLTILVKNFHSKLLPVCPVPPPWLHPTGSAHICRILKLLDICLLISKLLLSLYLQEADLLPVRDAQIPLGGAPWLHRVGVQVTRIISSLYVEK